MGNSLCCCEKSEMPKASESWLVITDTDIVVLNEPAKSRSGGIDKTILAKNEIGQQNNEIHVISGGKPKNTEESSVIIGEKLSNSSTTDKENVVADNVVELALENDYLDKSAASVEKCETKEDVGEEFQPEPCISFTNCLSEEDTAKEIDNTAQLVDEDDKVGTKVKLEIERCETKADVGDEFQQEPCISLTNSPSEEDTTKESDTAPQVGNKDGTKVELETEIRNDMVERSMLASSVAEIIYDEVIEIAEEDVESVESQEGVMATLVGSDQKDENCCVQDECENTRNEKLCRDTEREQLEQGSSMEDLVENGNQDIENRERNDDHVVEEDEAMVGTVATGELDNDGEGMENTGSEKNNATGEQEDRNEHSMYRDV